MRPRLCPESRRGPARVGPGEELCLDVWVCLYEYTMDMASQTSDLSLSDETFFAEVRGTQTSKTRKRALTTVKRYRTVRVRLPLRGSNPRTRSQRKE